jgi:hypothetical protein
VVRREITHHLDEDVCVTEGGQRSADVPQREVLAVELGFVERRPDETKGGAQHLEALSRPMDDLRLVRGAQLALGTAELFARDTADAIAD